MLKIYKLDEADPWIYQKSYTPIMIEMIINGKRKQEFNKVDCLKKQKINEKVENSFIKNNEKKKH